MKLVKNIVIKSTISLFAGAATLIGSKVAGMIWDKCASNEKKQ